MIYIILGIAGLLLIVALFTFLGKREPEQENITLPDPECCGVHEVCEKGLKKILPEIEYFNDEELDLLKETPPDSYTDQQIDEFREVLYTLKKEEINDWLVSLEKRTISFPDPLKQELFNLLE